MALPQNRAQVFDLPPGRLSVVWVNSQSWIKTATTAGIPQGVIFGAQLTGDLAENNLTSQKALRTQTDISPASQLLYLRSNPQKIEATDPNPLRYWSPIATLSQSFLTQPLQLYGLRSSPQKIEAADPNPLRPNPFVSINAQPWVQGSPPQLLYLNSNPLSAQLTGDIAYRVDRKVSTNSQGWVEGLPFLEESPLLPPGIQIIGDIARGASATVAVRTFHDQEGFSLTLLMPVGIQFTGDIPRGASGTVAVRTQYDQQGFSLPLFPAVAPFLGAAFDLPLSRADLRTAAILAFQQGTFPPLFPASPIPPVPTPTGGAPPRGRKIVYRPYEPDRDDRIEREIKDKGWKRDLLRWGIEDIYSEVTADIAKQPSAKPKTRKEIEKLIDRTPFVLEQAKANVRLAEIHKVLRLVMLEHERQMAEYAERMAEYAEHEDEDAFFLLMH